MTKVNEYVGRPLVKMAKSIITEFDFNDFTNKVGKMEGKPKVTDLKEKIRKQ